MGRRPPQQRRAALQGRNSLTGFGLDATGLATGTRSSVSVPRSGNSSCRHGGFGTSP
jgi:hypothetical protein